MTVTLCCTGSVDSGIMPPMKYWEIIADRLHAEGWSYGIAEHFTKHGLLFCVDAHRDGKRFIVKADDLLTAFISLEGDALAQKALTGMQRATVNTTWPNLTKCKRISVRFRSTTHLPEATL
jgi:hypothetical protein